MENDYSRIIKKANIIPDTVYFSDEHGNELPELGEIELNRTTKIVLAHRMIRHKQSLETCLMRMIKRGIKHVDKNEV